MRKTILITGSTDGIGKLAAFQLVKKGHQVIIHGRSDEKVKACLHELLNTTSQKDITGYTADFAQLSQVAELTKQIKSDFSSIDVIINNAGIFKSSTLTTRDGFDLRLGVNFLAPVVLTNHLLTSLSSDSRIINLSSAAQSPVNLTALQGKEKLSIQTGYAQSKLALTMWTNYFKKRNAEITSSAVNPGSLLNTKMALEAYGQYWSSADKGAEVLVNLSTSDEYHLSQELYFDNDKGDVQGHFSAAHSDAYDELKINELMRITSEILKPYI